MRTSSFVAAVCVFSVALIAADNPFVGTWKLNTAKSKGTPGFTCELLRQVGTRCGQGITAGFDELVTRVGLPLLAMPLLERHGGESPNSSILKAPHYPVASHLSNLA
jgi:hypothetical protein